jgi:hypothetical protein
VSALGNKWYWSPSGSGNKIEYLNVLKLHNVLNPSTDTANQSSPTQSSTTYSVANAKQFNKALNDTTINKSGNTIKLTADIDMSGYAWIPVSYLYANIDGCGYSIKNLFSYGAQTCGTYLSIYTYQGGFVTNIGANVTIKNITFENMYFLDNHLRYNYSAMNSEYYSGMIAGGSWGNVNFNGVYLENIKYDIPILYGLSGYWGSSTTWTYRGNGVLVGYNFSSGVTISCKGIVVDGFRILPSSLTAYASAMQGR